MIHNPILRGFNPDSVLQKSGHGSYVETPGGEVYLFHLCSRPFVPELRCTLGRETAVQKMMWTEDGWLRMADGTNLAKSEVPESSLPESPVPQIPQYDDFDSGEIGNWYYAPRQMPSSFADVTSRKGYIRIRGAESGTSLNRVSLLARKLTGVHARVTTKMDFAPEVFQHSAGLILYYDNMNFILLRKLGKIFDTTKFSDEYSEYGEFTGTFVGMTCADRVKHERCAYFDYFEYITAI